MVKRDLWAMAAPHFFIGVGYSMLAGNMKQRLWDMFPELTSPEVTNEDRTWACLFMGEIENNSDD